MVGKPPFHLARSMPASSMLCTAVGCMDDDVTILLMLE